MLVYTRELTNRLKYILEFIFEEVLQLDLQITSDSEQFNSSNHPKINYSDQFFENSFRIKPASLLFEKSIIEQDLYLPVWNNMRVMYLTDPESDIPFDPFAAAFFMLSRYEEYMNDETDLHGRFDVYNCFAYNNDFLNSPVVDLWIMELKNRLISIFPGIKINPTQYEYIPTIDIDEPFAFKHKGFMRTIGGFLNSGSRNIKGEKRLRLKVLFGKEKDPYDTFDLLEQWHNTHKSSPIFFFQVGKRGKFDKNPPLSNRAYSKLVKKISEKYEIGIHPSYRSNSDPSELKAEIASLQKVIGKPIQKSRQHYLKMRIPETYRKLIQFGIKEDYTMGYAGETGYRAGTSNPFFFYDLQKEEKTGLRIFPFLVMDGTLREHLRMDTSEAIERIKMLISQSREVNGTFASLWHNSSLSNWGSWAGWREVYEEMVKLAKE